MGGLASAGLLIGSRGYSYRFAKSVAKITNTAEVRAGAPEGDRTKGLYHGGAANARFARPISRDGRIARRALE